jgi:hypothetical protein
MNHWKTATKIGAVLMSLGTVIGGDGSVQAVDRPIQATGNDHYVSNRAPLRPSALIKLPIGAIRPEGWLRKQLELQADGMMGHLGEISGFLKKEGNAWLSESGEGSQGWEEVPYWLKGYLNTALVLGDKEMLDEAKVWIEGALASRQEDGWFGPDADRGGAATRLKGRVDLWPNMIMLFCLQDYHDATGDERVLELMQHYFRYLLTVPDEEFLLGYWPRIRGGDQLYTIYWLYNRTGEEWLLELAAKTHRRTARWDEGIADWHNVNFAQCFGEAATWWLQSGEAGDLRSAEKNWLGMRELYGQVPGGMFGSDENCRPGRDDPRQAIETCGIVEEMLSDEILLAITGDLAWADRCEDAAFNSLPAALTEDLRSLRYLTSPNQVLSDAADHSPGVQNGGPMFHYTPHRHRCCQHNHGHGWPYLAEHLWYATPDNGVAAVFYSASTVEAEVGGEGRTAIIRQETKYPFRETVELTVQLEEPTVFPLYLRVPGWCAAPALEIDGEAVSVTVEPGQYLRIERSWKSGDRVSLALPMSLALRRWGKNHDSVSVDRGPLTYSLRIDEKRVRSGDSEVWGAWEVFPASPWNYALSLDEKDPLAGFELTVGEWPEDDQPWTLESTPLSLSATGRKIPQWILDRHGMCPELQDSPVRSAEPDERITLVPMGAARLRISSFPVAGSGAEAAVWEEPHFPKRNFETSASHTFGGDDVGAVADSLVPTSSNDHDISRHTFWPHQGTEEWIEARFPLPRRCELVRVYWFDDTDQGQCRVPSSWRLSYLRDGEWTPVELRDEAAGYGVAEDCFNVVRFEPVKVERLRLEITLREDYSGGVLEWIIE